MKEKDKMNVELDKTKEFSRKEYPISWSDVTPTRSREEDRRLTG